MAPYRSYPSEYQGTPAQVIATLDTAAGPKCSILVVQGAPSTDAVLAVAPVLTNSEVQR